jgi:hypothetical protein
VGFEELGRDGQMVQHLASTVAGEYVYGAVTRGGQGGSSTSRMMRERTALDGAGVRAASSHAWRTTRPSPPTKLQTAGANDASERHVRVLQTNDDDHDDDDKTS